MKKVTLVFASILLGFLLTVSSPVVAQDNSAGTTQTAHSDDDGDEGKWGLAGLLGLLGLLGLKKRDDDNDRKVNVNRKVS